MTGACEAQARSLVGATRQAGVSSLRRLALVSRVPEPELAREIRDLCPGVVVLDVDAGAGRAGVRLVLATSGTLDAIVDLTTNGDGRARRARELLPHLRKGGVLVLRDAARVVGADVLMRRVGPFVEAGLRASVCAGPAQGDRPPTVPVLARVGVHETHLWLVSGRRTWTKVREEEAAEYLTRMGPRAGRVLHELPAARVVRHDEVVASASDDAVDCANAYDAPPLQLREYEKPVSRRGQVVTQGRVVLPDTFRHFIRPVLTNHFIQRVDRNFAHLRTMQSPARLEGVYFLLDSEFRGHFGHAMTEQLSRLWAWPEVKRRYPDAKALVHTRRPYPTLAGWEHQLYEAAGVAPADLVLVDGPVRPDRLVAATPAFSQPNYVHPAVRDVYRRTGDALASKAPDRAYPDRIFCSRRISKRECRNTGEVEEFFASRGFEVLFPEDYPLTEQAQLFRSARDVAGFGGSAMLSLAFAPEPKRVILVSADTYYVQNEAMITAINGHRLYMAWCRGEAPPGVPIKSRARLHAPFTFDADREGAFLRRVLDGAAPA
ncbi:hypothetical protein GCM10007368_22440 [Isoptericola cucumis]|uniref:Glycosyltransferase 61 catalytic domain-containing protein n=1 Tax=Isoptericola cucumis TaxID=1776856 RepID=A0ABQ2B7L5_9MICO|nr:hypothetical protein GCM10007368_22440 [Isoptericola cucumis]